MFGTVLCTSKSRSVSETDDANWEEMKQMCVGVFCGTTNGGRIARSLCRVADGRNTIDLVMTATLRRRATEKETTAAVLDVGAADPRPPLFLCLLLIRNIALDAPDKWILVVSVNSFNLYLLVMPLTALFVSFALDPGGAVLVLVPSEVCRCGVRIFFNNLWPLHRTSPRAIRQSFYLENLEN